MKNLLEKHPDVEASLVGKLLMDGRRCAGVSELIEPSDFSCPEYSKIYAVIIRQWSAGHKLDDKTVAAELDPAIADLAIDAYAGTGSAIGASHLAEQIKEASIRRRLNTEAKRVVKATSQDERPVADILEAAKQSIDSIGHIEKRRKTEDIILGVVKSSQEAAASQHGTVGIPTGFRRFDNITGGLKKTDLVYIAARPSVGKTSLALNIIHNILHGTDECICMFSAEMSEEQVWLRLIAQMTGLDGNRIMRGDLSPDQWSLYSDTAQKCVDKFGERLYIDPKSSPTPGHIRAVAMQRRQQGRLGLIVTDYVNLMSVPGINGSDQLALMTECAKASKNTAKDLDVPYVLLAQLKRGSEGREVMEVPGLTDIKYAGEEPADIAALLHRGTRSSTRGLLKIAKNRNGPTGEFPLNFDGPTTTFSED